MAVLFRRPRRRPLPPQGGGGGGGSPAAGLIDPATQFIYKGGSRLNTIFPSPSSNPDRNKSFSNAGNRLVFNPAGNGGLGSLLIGGRNAEGADRGQIWVAEVDIPTPVISATKTAADLPTANFLRASPYFYNPLSGISDQEAVGEAFRYGGGIVITTPKNGVKLFSTRTRWYNTGQFNHRSIGASNFDFTSPQGLWHVGPLADPLYHHNQTSGPIWALPDSFIAAHSELTGWKYVTGMFIQQGTSSTSHGPCWCLVKLWDSNGDLYPDGADLPALLVKYHPQGTDRSLIEWDHRATNWYSGTEFLSIGSTSAIVVFGTQSLNGCLLSNPNEAGRCNIHNTPYGNPYSELIPIFGDRVTCAGNDGPGYHCGPYQWEVKLYDPQDMIRVLQSTLDPRHVRPYYRYWLGPTGVEESQVYPDTGQTCIFSSGPNLSWNRKSISEYGTGKCLNITGFAYDPANQRFWVLEQAGWLNGPEQHPILHHFELGVRP